MDEKEREQEEEPKVIVRDRRRVTMEGTLRQVEEPSTPQPPPPTAEAQQAQRRPPLREVPPPPRQPAPQEEKGEGPDVYDLAKMMLMEFQYRALIHLGRMPDPETKLLAPDLEKARFAIDMVIAIADRLQASGQLNPKEQQEVRELKHLLQSAYVEQVMGGRRETAPRPPFRGRPSP